MFKKNFKPYREPTRSGGSLVSFSSTRHSVRDSGKDVTYSDIDIFDKYPPLPSPDNFSLEKQIAAGVTMKEVNSMILSDDGEITPDIEQQITESLDKENQPEVINPEEE